MTTLLEAERATELLSALRKHILGGGALICGYNQAGELIGLSDNHSKVVGQICSRLDLASFNAGLPMLALHWIRKPDGDINPAAFNGIPAAVAIWQQFDQEVLETAATYQWSENDFNLMQAALDRLSNDSSTILWNRIESKILEKGEAFIRYSLHRHLRKQA